MAEDVKRARALSSYSANVIATLTGMAGSIYWVDQVVPSEFGGFFEEKIVHVKFATKKTFPTADSGFRYKAPCAGNAFLGSARNRN